MDSAFAIPNVTIRTLSDLQGLLPRLASALSMSRAHLVIDQLRNLVGQSRGDEIILLTWDPTANDSSSTDNQQAAVVVHHDKQADFATMMLVGWSAGKPTADSDDKDNVAAEAASIGAATDAIARVLEPLLFQRGARFLQFATDVTESPTATPNPTETAWQNGMGLQHIGNLEYLSGAVDHISSSIKKIIESEPRIGLTFDPVESISDFATLVDRTYSQTMDCPLMSTFRNAKQTLGGYRHNDAYSPELWYTVRESGVQNADDHKMPISDSQAGKTAPGAEIGCLLMGKHVSKETHPESGDSTSEPSGSPDRSAVVSELVYMGLVPEMRGSGLGRQMIKQAARVSQHIGAERMILAVDESNHPARDLYHRVGLQPMMRESVWGRLVTNR